MGEILAGLYDAVVPFVGGTSALLIGFRVIGKRPGESETDDRWHARFGPILKVVAPLLILFGLFMVAAGSTGEHFWVPLVVPDQCLLRTASTDRVRPAPLAAARSGIIKPGLGRTGPAELGS